MTGLVVGSLVVIGILAAIMSTLMLWRKASDR